MNAFYELPGRHQYINGHFVRNNLQLSPRFYFVGVPLEWNKFLVISKRKKSRKKSLILTAFFFPAFTYFLLFYFPLFFFFCALALKPWIRPMNKTRFFFINIDKEMESRVHTFLNVKQSVLNIDKRVLRKKKKKTYNDLRERVNKGTAITAFCTVDFPWKSILQTTQAALSAAFPLLIWPHFPRVA